MKPGLLLKELEIIGKYSLPDSEVKNIVSDSRKVKEGSIYADLKSVSGNDNNYIGEALENGALFVVTERPLSESVPHVLVKNSRAALALMCAAFYEHPERGFEKIYAVTGTNGKTSTAVMLANIMKESGKKTGFIGTLGCFCDFPHDGVSFAHMTTPDPQELFYTLSLMRKSGTQIVIMEASSHSIALDKICPIRFSAAIFTNLTPEHMDFHRDMQSYHAAKEKLLLQCDKAFFNTDDRYFSASYKKGLCQSFSFSVNFSGADYSAQNVVLEQEKARYEFLSLGKLFRIKLPFPGLFSVYNSLGAAALAVSEGIDEKTVSRALEFMDPVPGRMQAVRTGADFRAYIDYAHTPDALAKVIKELSHKKKGRVIAVFGCGGDRDRKKRPLMGAAATNNADFVIVTSDNSRGESPEKIISEIVKGIKKDNYIIEPDRKKAIHLAVDMARGGDVILLAGKGHEQYEIINAKENKFSEQEILLEYINEKRNTGENNS